MFERVQFEEWQSVITLVAFLLCFGTFVFVSWRAIRMKKRDRQRLAAMPLQQDQDPEISSHE